MNRVILVNRAGDDAHYLMKDISNSDVKTEAFGFDACGVDDILLYTATKEEDTDYYIIDCNNKKLRPTNSQNLFVPV